MRLLLLTAWSVFSYCIPTSVPQDLLPRPVTMPSVAQLIVREAVSNGVPPALAFWLAMSESYLNPKAVSDNGPGRAKDYGLFQLNGASFPDAVLMTPEQNVAAGLGYFGKLYRQCGKRPECAVRAYRSGKVR